LVTPIKTGSDFQWMRHDLTPYKGHLVHIEFSAAEGFDFAVSMVVQGEHVPSAFRRSNAAVLHLLEGDTGQSTDGLAAGYRKLFLDVVERLSPESGVNSRLTGDHASLANWLLRHPELVTCNSGTPGNGLSEAVAAWITEETKLDQGVLARTGPVAEIESAIANYETAYRMQTAVPELMDIRGETEASKKLYGLDSRYIPTQIFASQCLIARRLVERGARFIELTCPNTGGDRWDQHSGLKKGHENNCLAVDLPIAGLLKDLKARGMLQNTLVIWAGEFGRTPFAQGSDGRDHNQFGFTIWMAGGGVKGGIAFGETDEWGYKVIQNKVEIHDLHATILHLLGIDHKQLTFRFGGRDMRLTDVHGAVVHEILD
jgi:hypothetical protein